MALASNFRNKKIKEIRHEANHKTEGHYKLQKPFIYITTFRLKMPG